MFGLGVPGYQVVERSEQHDGNGGGDAEEHAGHKCYDAGDDDEKYDDGEGADEKPAEGVYEVHEA